MLTIENCKNLTNPKLLIEIRNRDTIVKGISSQTDKEKLRKEITELWKLMEKNSSKN